jgi:maleylacetoacetate isomerase
MTTTPVLYDYWRSSACYRVRIALNLKGFTYLAEPVNLLAMAHKAPDHLARQPQGLVPALAIDGAMLTQSLAILEYLDETQPEPRLLPTDPMGRHRVRALAHAVAMEIHPVCNMGVVAHMADVAGGGDQIKADWMQYFIGRGLAALEIMLGNPATGLCCHGDAPGMADCCLVPQAYNARRWNVALPPTIARIVSHCEALEPFQRAHPDRVGPPPGAL